MHVRVAPSLATHTATSLDVESLLNEGSTNADGLDDKVLGLEAVSNAHQVAGVVNDLVERILLLIAKAKLLQSVRHGKTVDKTGNLNHASSTDGHGSRLRECLLGSLANIQLGILLLIDDSKCSGLCNQKETMEITVFVYLAKERVWTVTMGLNMELDPDPNRERGHALVGRKTRLMEEKLRVIVPERIVFPRKDIGVCKTAVGNKTMAIVPLQRGVYSIQQVDGVKMWSFRQYVCGMHAIQRETRGKQGLRRERAIPATLASNLAIHPWGMLDNR